MTIQESPVMLARSGLRNRTLSQYFLRDVEAIASEDGQTVAYLHYGKMVSVHALRHGESILYKDGRTLTTKDIEAWTKSQNLGMHFVRCNRNTLINDIHIKEYRPRNIDADKQDGIVLMSGAIKGVCRRLAPTIKKLFKHGAPAICLSAMTCHAGDAELLRLLECRPDNLTCQTGDIEHVSLTNEGNSQLTCQAGDIEPVQPAPTPSPINIPKPERAIAALRMHELLGSAASIGLPVAPIFNPYTQTKDDPQSQQKDIAFDWRVVVPGRLIP